MIQFQCPKCGMQYEVEDEFLGARAECEGCNTKFFIPSKGNDEEMVVAHLADGHIELPVEEQTNQPTNLKDAPPGPSTEKVVIAFGQADSLVGPGQVPEEVPVAAPKLSPRQRRLMADWKKLSECFAYFPSIQVKSYAGNPPESYVIAYNVRGIERVDGDRIVYRSYHEVEIKLPGTYPRTPPLCRMLTPIFHPNIEPAVICIGDHWTAAERLCDLIVRIGEMIAYQAHNIKSPLDGEAAMWTDLHMDMLPIDNVDLTPPNL